MALGIKLFSPTLQNTHTSHIMTAGEVNHHILHLLSSLNFFRDVNLKEKSNLHNVSTHVKGAGILQKAFKICMFRET